MKSQTAIRDLFDLSGRVALITGGAGLLGMKHAEVIASAGGTPVLIDLPHTQPQRAAQCLSRKFGVSALGLSGDVTSLDSLENIRAHVLQRFGRIDVLINNAANNPKVEAPAEGRFSRLENFPLECWSRDLGVGLMGPFLCSRVFGGEMAKVGKGGVVLNIASDLALIAPDQRLYRQENCCSDCQPVKPVTYSVVKSGLIGLTKYLATYWNECGIRVNALSPGGVENGQSDEFLSRISSLIPLRRMAHADEYQGAVLFLCSDASSYMTGANLVIDGGRTCW